MIERIRRCEQCLAIIPPSLTYFRMELTIAPFRAEVTAGGVRATSGEFCGAQCVQQRIAQTLSPASVTAIIERYTVG